MLSIKSSQNLGTEIGRRFGPRSRGPGPETAGRGAVRPGEVQARRLAEEVRRRREGAAEPGGGLLLLFPRYDKNPQYFACSLVCILRNNVNSFFLRKNHSQCLSLVPNDGNLCLNLIQLK